MTDVAPPKPVKRARARLAKPPKNTIEVVDKGTMLVRVEPARFISRVLVVDKTRGIHALEVHISSGIDGTLFVQVTDGLPL